MATYFISRHQGAVDWINMQNIHIDHFVRHLDITDIQANDIVIGTLPIHLGAEVCAKGAKFYFLSVNVTEQQRGTELSAQTLIEQGCELVPYFIQKL